MECETRTADRGVGGEIEGHDTGDGDAMEGAGATIGAQRGACAA